MTLARFVLHGAVVATLVYVLLGIAIVAAAQAIRLPDSSQLVYVSERQGRDDIILLDVISHHQFNLSRHPENDTFPLWSPDGQHLAFLSSREGHPELFVMAADGTDLRQLTDMGSSISYFEWTTDGQRLMFVVNRLRALGEERLIFTIHRDGTDLNQMSSVGLQGILADLTFEDRPAPRIAQEDARFVREAVRQQGFSVSLWWSDSRRFAFFVRDQTGGVLYVSDLDAIRAGARPQPIMQDAGMRGFLSWRPMTEGGL